MDDQVKICPSCEAEYYAHVDECRSCGIELVDPGQLEKARRELAGDAAGSFVCIMTGPVNMVKEVAGGLKARGFDARVLKSVAGGGCSGGEVGIFVEQSVAHAASHMAEEIRLSSLSGLVDVGDSYSEGKCPACGADVMSSPAECPDCGLNLGGGSTGDCAPGGDGSCGTC